MSFCAVVSGGGKDPGPSNYLRRRQAAVAASSTMRRGGEHDDPDADVRKPLKFSIGSDEEAGTPLHPSATRHPRSYSSDSHTPPSLRHLRIIRWLLRIFPRILLAIVVAALVVALLPGGWRVALCAANVIPAPPLRLGENVTLIAHRGCEFPFPENTVKALRYGADMLGFVELDLGLTSDGDAIVLHDDTLERTTNGTGNSCDQTTKYIKSLVVSLPTRDARGRISKARFCEEKTPSGQTNPCQYRVPTLSDVFDALPEGTKYIIDVKKCNTPGMQIAPACSNCTKLMEATKAAVAANFIKPEQLIFSGEQPEVLKVFQNGMPAGAAFSLTMDQKMSHYKQKTVLEMLSKGNFSYASMYVGLAAVRPDLVQVIRDAPLKHTMKHRDVIVWTVRRDLEFRLARCSGAGRIVVAEPDRMRKHLSWDVGSLLADDT